MCAIDACSPFPSLRDTIRPPSLKWRLLIFLIARTIITVDVYIVFSDVLLVVVVVPQAMTGLISVVTIPCVIFGIPPVVLGSHSRSSPSQSSSASISNSHRWSAKRSTVQFPICLLPLRDVIGIPGFVFDISIWVFLGDIPRREDMQRWMERKKTGKKWEGRRK